MLTALVLAFFVIPLVGGVLKFAFRLVGWTLSVVFGLLLLPVWIVIAIFGGVIVAAQALLPILALAFIVSLFVSEQ